MSEHQQRADVSAMSRAQRQERQALAELERSLAAIGCRLRPMRTDDAPALAALADRLVGKDYYTPAIALEYLAKATIEEEVCAWVAEAKGELVAFRFVCPPGRWEAGRGQGLSPERWSAPLAATAYFQSCFVDPQLMGHGVGRALALMAFQALRRLGARAVVTHSWKESPHDSSRRYLSRLGFSVVAEYPRYWSEIDYICPRDGQPCGCTALEMARAL